MKNLVTLKRWAEEHGISPATARQNAGRGKYETAQKLGRDWFIDKDEPNIDRRVKSGKYINWRKPSE